MCFSGMQKMAFFRRNFPTRRISKSLQKFILRDISTKYFWTDRVHMYILIFAVKSAPYLEFHIENGTFRVFRVETSS